jgi:EmrB/QacA subfamily drug resistance transporter
MFSLDTSSCSIAFPVLTRVFETGAAAVTWVTVAYLLAMTAFLLIFGRLGDLFGRKRIYLLGFIVFNIGLSLCSVSQSIMQLILFRVVQGIGAGMIMSVVTAIVTASFPDKERGKAMGVLEAVISAGVLAGPVLGGFLLDTLGWRSIFYIRIPVALIGIIMASLLLIEQKASGNRPSVDWWGAVTLFGGLSCLLLFINLGEQAGFASPLALVLAVAGVALIILFFIQERKAAQPVVELKLFKDSLFTGCNISFGILSFTSGAMIFLTSFYLIDGAGFSALQAGSLIAVAPLVSLVAAPLAGWLSDRIGTRLLRPAGISIFCLGIFIFSRFGIEPGVVNIMLAFFIIGIGIGTFGPTTESSIMGTVPRDRLGTAAAMMNTIRQIGSSSGTAVAGSLYASRQVFYAAQLARNNLDPQLLHQLSIVGSYNDIIQIAAIIGGVGILAALVGAKKTLNQ